MSENVMIVKSIGQFASYPAAILSSFVSMANNAEVIKIEGPCTQEFTGFAMVDQNRHQPVDSPTTLFLSLSFPVDCSATSNSPCGEFSYNKSPCREVQL